MLVYFSELKEMYGLIPQLTEVKIEKTMPSEAPIKHSFHHIDSFNACKKIKNSF